MALVDSGADRSLFPIDAAHLAGVDLDRCSMRSVRGVGGTAEVHLCTVGLVVEDRHVDAEVAFTSAPAHRRPALLGRHDVFTQFRFGFDQRAGHLLVEPYR